MDFIARGAGAGASVSEHSAKLKVNDHIDFLKMAV
jgi:hypothetical protein